jgi:glutamate racemase
LAKAGPVNLNPIGVFDSGLGGLSVVHHLRRELPAENLLYFGDTARVPYGSKSRRTVVSFALEAARFLLQYEPKLIVAACNTASALALDELQRELPVPVIGVVEPAAEWTGRGSRLRWWRNDDRQRSYVRR